MKELQESLDKLKTKTDPDLKNPVSKE